MKDYYKVLEVGTNATAGQIKKAYRTLAKKHHPDVTAGNEQDERIFKEINEAYHILENEESRAKYNAQRSSTRTSNASQGEHPKKTQQQSTQYDFNDMSKNFENFFGFNPKTKEYTDKNQHKKKDPLDSVDRKSVV